jgi:hypothetical protein
MCPIFLNRFGLNEKAHVAECLAGGDYDGRTGGKAVVAIVAAVAKTSFAPDEKVVYKLLQCIDSRSFDIFQIEDDDLPKVEPSSLPTIFQQNKRNFLKKNSTFDT